MLEVTNNGNGKEKHYIMENSVYAPSQALERIMQAGEKKNTPACCTLYIVGNAGRNFCCT